MVQANRRFEAARTDPGSVDVYELTVGFVDLDGSTALAERLDATSYSELLAALDALVADTVAGHGGRVVKSLGDGAMFVVRDTDAACEIGAQLVASSRDLDGRPSVRVGLAAGPVTGRDGDYFGPVVHLAARIVAIAAPGTVLASDGVRARVTARDLEPVGSRSLRGFDQAVEVHRLVP
jgi:adenylate cyclase